MQQRQAISGMGGSMSGLLGQVAAGGSVLGQQMAEAIGHGMGLKTAEEVAVERQSQQAKAVMTADMDKLTALREQFIADPNANPALISALDERITKLQEKDVAATRAKNAGAMIRSQFGNESVATAVESGAFAIEDAVDLLSKEPNVHVVGNTAIKSDGTPVFSETPETFSLLSPEEVEAAGAPVGTVLKKNNKTGEVVKVTGPAPRTANYGNPPKDHRWIEAVNADGSVSVWAEVIEGTPTDEANKAAKGKEKKSMVGWSRQQDLMDMKLTEAIEFAEANPDAAAGKGARFVEDSLRIPFVGALFAATDEADFQSALMTLRSNIGFDRLQRMREESPTGGALGQVAIMELEALQASLGSLNVNQSPQQMTNNLKVIRSNYRKVGIEYAKHFSEEELESFGLSNLAAMKRDLASGKITEEDVLNSSDKPKAKKDTAPTTVKWKNMGNPS